MCSVAEAKNCQWHSARAYLMGVKQYGHGNVRLVTGLYKKQPHRWVEYLAKGKWRMWDNAIWYVGKSWWERKDYPEYEKLWTRIPKGM